MTALQHGVRPSAIQAAAKSHRVALKVSTINRARRSSRGRDFVEANSL
jgi:hypothetical protein